MITIAEFRSTPELVSEMRKLLQAPVMKIWLEAMDNSNPAKFPVKVGIQPHDAMIMLGEQTGWMNYRDTFLNGATPLEPVASELPQTYAEPVPEPE